MKNKSDIIIGMIIGVILMYILYASKKKPIAAVQKTALDSSGNNSGNDTTNYVGADYLTTKQDILRLGNLQHNINYLMGLEPKLLQVNGQFDQNTTDLLSDIFQNTGCLVSNEKCIIDACFVDNMNMAINRICGGEEFSHTPAQVNYTYTDLIKKGDAGKEVEMLQYVIQVITKNQDIINNTGNYNKETADIVTRLWEGSSVMVDNESGAISKTFVTDFYTVLQNVDGIRKSLSNEK